MVVVNDLEQFDICIKRLGPELFVKPAQGSSVGAHVVRGTDQLKALEDAQAYIAIYWSSHCYQVPNSRGSP